MSYEERHRVPASQPYLSGHFPGDPTVPAVVILELVLETIRKWKDEVDVSRVQYVKFKAPLLPDVSFAIGLRDIGDRAIGFECRTEDLVIAEGQAELSTPV